MEDNTFFHFSEHFTLQTYKVSKHLPILHPNLLCIVPSLLPMLLPLSFLPGLSPHLRLSLLALFYVFSQMSTLPLAIAAPTTPIS